MESIFKICIRIIFLIEDKKLIKIINCDKKGWSISWVIGNIGKIGNMIFVYLCCVGW